MVSKTTVRLGLLTTVGLMASMLSLGTVSAPGNAAGVPAADDSPDLFSAAPAIPARAKVIKASARAARDRMVTLNSSLLPARASGQRIDLNLFADANFTGRVDSRRVHDSYTEWSGRLSTELGSWLAVQTDDTYMLHISSPQGVYEVTRAVAGGDAYRVTEVRQDIREPKDDYREPGDFAKSIPADSAKGGDISQMVKGHKQPKPLSRTDSRKVQDIAILWSPQASAAYGGEANMQAYAAISVALSNQIYAQSGISTSLRLVGAAPTNINEVGDFDTDLVQMTRGRAGYRNVHKYRDYTHADLVSLFIAGNAYCGLAWINSPSKLAYSVTNPDCVSNLSVTHEIGHNQGAQHDKYVGGQTAFKFARGYVNVAGGWRTVMAYNNQCLDNGINCTRIGFMSTPKATWGGAPAGNKKRAYNAKAVNKTAKRISDFRQSQIYAKKVKIIGKAKKGRTVRAKTNAKKWNPKPRIKWQWYIDGYAVPGKKGTKSKLKLKKAWKGHVVTVAAIGKKKWYAPTVKLSKGKRIK